MKEQERLGTDDKGRAIYACAHCGTQNGAPYIRKATGRVLCRDCDWKPEANEAQAAELRAMLAEIVDIMNALEIAPDAERRARALLARGR